jgi:Na+/proline symporter
MVAVWMSLEGGPARVAEISRGLGRNAAAEFDFSWSDPWTLFGALPFWLLTVLIFSSADQLTVQRFLSAKSENAARSAFLYAALALTVLLPGLIYAGLCVLAFYYDRPQEMRPEWVVNIDNKTREAMLGQDKRTLLDPQNPAHSVTFENIDRLVAEGRILQPNSKEPFTTDEGLVDPDTNQVLIEKLAMRRPNTESLRGEIIVSRAAPEQMLPHFAARHLTFGAAGLVLAALIGAALAAVDAGLTSLVTVIVHDLVSRFGIGQAWRGREPGPLTPLDELQLARPLTIGLGVVIIAEALVAAQFPMGIGLLIRAAGALGAPLAAVLLLGMLTRQTTAAAALIALLGGAVFTLALAAVDPLAAAGLVPPTTKLADLWIVLFGFGLTLVVGLLLSFVLGRRKSNHELRGLVAGCGTLGLRATQEEVPLITVPEEQSEIRWK